MVYYDILWRIMVYCGIFGYIIVYYGLLEYVMVYCSWVVRGCAPAASYLLRSCSQPFLAWRLESPLYTSLQRAQASDTV